MDKYIKIGEIANDLSKSIFDNYNRIYSVEAKKGGIKVTSDKNKIFVGMLSQYVYALTLVIENHSFNTTKESLERLKELLVDASIRQYMQESKTNISNDDIIKDYKMLMNIFKNTWNATQNYPQPPDWYISKELCKYLDVNEDDILVTNIYLTGTFSSSRELINRLLTELTATHKLIL